MIRPRISPLAVIFAIAGAFAPAIPRDFRVISPIGGDGGKDVRFCRPGRYRRGTAIQLPKGFKAKKRKLKRIAEASRRRNRLAA